MSTSVPYSEFLLHWLWKNNYLCNQQLKTTAGDKVMIHHPGYANVSDGPDFTNARVTIGSLKWHGDIEIHWTSNDWYNHTHHTNPDFNQVILHVVFDDSKSDTVHREDKTAIPTLLMKPFLSKPLQYFFHHYQQPEQLPCAGNISSIPHNVIVKQFNRAHTEYFEQKVNDILQFYDAALPLSEAWQKMLTMALFDGLGISHNRKPMRQLARVLWNEYPSTVTKKELPAKALQIAGIKPENATAPFNWKRKGSRPANHPKIRIKQACKILIFIKNLSFKRWLRTGLDQIFVEMLKEVDTSPGIGRRRSGVLRGTIWLPAYYLLGDLTGTKKLTSKAKKMWSNHRTPLPASVASTFQEADFPSNIYREKLGSVHQLRAYCKPHQCQQCEVFKCIISS